MNRQTVCSTDLVIHTFPEKRKKKNRLEVLLTWEKGRTFLILTFIKGNLITLLYQLSESILKLENSHRCSDLPLSQFMIILDSHAKVNDSIQFDSSLLGAQ